MLICALVLIPICSAEAQPIHADAEARFTEAVALFEAGDFESAREIFATVRLDFPRHRKTSAAWLMEAKALYRMGEYALCIDLLENFPGDEHASAAARTLRYARKQQEHEERLSAAFVLGVVLPLGVQDVSLAQSLFNGIRIAVDEWNDSSDPPVRIVFRNSRNTAEGARRAVEALALQGVDVIIGPLFSGEAHAAAAEANVRGVVMVAPLATDRDIARSREYVFQANPPPSARGVFLARVGIERLGAQLVGVVSDGASRVSQRMADGFSLETERLGADVIFHQTLIGPERWGLLGEVTEPFDSVDVVFLPIHDDLASESTRQIVKALGVIADLEDPPPILGGTAWNDVALSRYAAGLDVAFADVFYVNKNLSAVRRFSASYREASGGNDPGRLAYVGYDVARFVVELLSESGAESLAESLRTARTYEGLGTRINFDRDRVNEEMFLLTYTSGGVRPVR